MSRETCPTCGTPVEVVSSDEGTSFYRATSVSEPDWWGYTVQSPIRGLGPMLLTFLSRKAAEAGRDSDHVHFPKDKLGPVVALYSEPVRASEPTEAETLRTLDDVLSAIHDAESEYRAAVEATLPINSWVTVKHGERRTGVWVIGHAYGRVHVRNPDSEKDYWVDASRLVEHETFRLRTPTESRAGEEPKPKMCAQCGSVATNTRSVRCSQCGDCLTCGVGFDRHGIGCPRAPHTPGGTE